MVAGYYPVDSPEVAQNRQKKQVDFFSFVDCQQRILKIFKLRSEQKITINFSPFQIRAKTADILIHLIDVSKLHVQGELLAKHTLYLNEELNQFYAADKRDKTCEHTCSHHSATTKTSTDSAGISGNPIVTQSNPTNTVHVLNKIDLVPLDVRQKLSDLFKHQRNVIQLSCMTGENLVNLIQLIGNSVEKLIAADNPERQDDFLTERHENHLRRIVESISLAIDAIEEDRSISAYHVENSINEIAAITGSITTEQIIDVIFKNFCIGK